MRIADWTMRFRILGSHGFSMLQVRFGMALFSADYGLRTTDQSKDYKWNIVIRPRGVSSRRVSNMTMAGFVDAVPQEKFGQGMFYLQTKSDPQLFKLIPEL